MPDPQKAADLAHRMEKGQRAQALLDDETFKAAIMKTEERYVTGWKSGTSVEQREDMWAKYHALADVVREVRAMIGDGVIAAEEKRQQDKREARQLVGS